MGGNAKAQPATRAATPTPRTRFGFGRNRVGIKEGRLTRAIRTGPTSIRTLPVAIRVHIHHGVPLPKVAASEKRKCSGQTMSSCAGGESPAISEAMKTMRTCLLYTSDAAD